MTFDPYSRNQSLSSADPLAGIRSDIDAYRAEVERKLSNAAQHIRRRDELADRKLAEINGALNAIKGMRSAGSSDDNPGIKRIENIPGRRVPFTLLVDIPIGANVTSVQQASVTISQEGPFVAVSRMATFMSAFEAQYSNPDTGSIARFAGRSFGRYRPIHSAWDLNDSHTPSMDPSGWLQTIYIANGNALPPNVSSGIPGAVSSTSGYRTMEFDGRIQVINAGSSYPRQNIPVPSSMWSKSINEGVPLGALDFFERGEVLSVLVAPNHVNNPPAGNVDGNVIFGSMFGPFTSTTSWPFLQGQYDAHEGIATPNLITSDPVQGDPVTLASDPITRLPDGLLTIGWEGYRIIQPVAP